MGAHMMPNIDHPHQESLTLKVKDHLDMLSVQCLVNCLEEDHVCHHNSRAKTQTHEENSRHDSTVLPSIATIKKESLQNLHTHAVLLFVVVDPHLVWRCPSII